LSAMHSLGKRISPVHHSSRSEQFNFGHLTCKASEVHPSALTISVPVV